MEVFVNYIAANFPELFIIAVGLFNIVLSFRTFKKTGNIIISDSPSVPVVVEKEKEVSNEKDDVIYQDLSALIQYHEKVCGELRAKITALENEKKGGE